MKLIRRFFSVLIRSFLAIFICLGAVFFIAFLIIVDIFEDIRRARQWTN